MAPTEDDFVRREQVPYAVMAAAVFVLMGLYGVLVLVDVWRLLSPLALG